MGKQDRCVACKIDISVISNLLYLRNKIGGCETNVNLSSKIFDHRDESNISRSEHGEITSHFAHTIFYNTLYIFCDDSNTSQEILEIVRNLLLKKKVCVFYFTGPNMHGMLSTRSFRLGIYKPSVIAVL